MSAEICKHGVNKIDVCNDCLRAKYSEAEHSFAAPAGSDAPICKCGQPMRRSRRRALDIDGWICMGMVHDIITKDLETASANHTKPIAAQPNGQDQA